MASRRKSRLRRDSPHYGLQASRFRPPSEFATTTSCTDPRGSSERSYLAVAFSHGIVGLWIVCVVGVPA